MSEIVKDIVSINSDEEFLLQKIKELVSYDFGSSLSGRNLLPDSSLSGRNLLPDNNNISPTKFDKQVTRLFQACQISETDREYIFNRIIDLPN
jgi:hypothetical protein